MSKSIVIVILTVTMLLPGCSDDDPVRPESFAVSIRIVDEQGSPVPDLLVAVTSDSDFMQDQLSKSTVTIPFTTLGRSHCRVTIEDVTGDEIRTLMDGWAIGGDKFVEWDGKDNDGIHQHSGYYTVRLVVSEVGTETVLWEGTAPMLMCLLSADRVPAGVTDSNGSLVLTDKRLFPHLYDVSPQMATNESGESIGTMVLDESMIIAVGDTVSHTTMFVVTEISGSINLELLWAPRPSWSPLRREPAPPKSAVALAEPEYRIGPVFPNPFN